MTSENQLRDLCSEVGEASQALESARSARDNGIAAAAAAGLRMRDLVRITGLTREHIRRIIRAAESNIA